MACSRRRRWREDGVVEREVATSPRPRLGSRSFFKIILSNALESGKLGIPKRFLRRCGKDLSNLVLLKVPGGSTWTIELEKCNNDMVLLWKGWREFMEHYSIGHGHLLVFKYRGNSTFRVIIFNKSASEIDYSSSSGKTSYLGSELPSPEKEDVVETEDLEDVTPHQRMRSERHLPYSQLSPSNSRRGSEGTWSPRYVVPIDTDPEEPNLSQAQAGLTDMIKQPTCRMSRSELVFHGPTLPRPLTTPELVRKIDSEHPFFKKAIRQSNKDQLYIPGGFITQHIQEKQRATLRYANRSWSVRLIRGSRRVGRAPYLSFSAGWGAFARETNLRVGNVCVFKLIDRNDIVFEVSILSGELDFHGPTLSKPLKSSGLASNIDSEHPFFILVIPRCFMKCLGVPVGFAKQHLQEHEKMATLQYSNRSWPVKIIGSPRQATGIRTLSAGWCAFARETHLCAGNVCLFELINRDDTVFKVSILSGAGNDPVHINRDEQQKYHLRPLQHRNDISSAAANQ